jgi:hypothetical protein
MNSVCHSLRLPHTKDFSDILQKQCVPILENSGIEPMLYRRGLQRADLHSINTLHRLRSHYLCPNHRLLLTLRKQLSLLMAKFLVSLQLFLSSPRVL